MITIHVAPEWLTRSTRSDRARAGGIGQLVPAIGRGRLALVTQRIEDFRLLFQVGSLFPFDRLVGLLEHSLRLLLV